LLQFTCDRPTGLYDEFWLETMTCRLVCCSLVIVISIVGVSSVPGDVSIVGVRSGGQTGEWAPVQENRWAPYSPWEKFH